MSDLISRQAAAEVIYKALKTPVFHFPDYRKDPFHDTMGLAFAMANEIPSAQPEQRWIPCSERLPLEQESDYWICTDTGYQCQCRWTRNRYGLGIYDKWGWKLIDIPQHTHVIAWQPLPEPYKADMNNPLQNTQLH